MHKIRRCRLQNMKGGTVQVHGKTGVHYSCDLVLHCLSPMHSICDGNVFFLPLYVRYIGTCHLIT